MYFMHTSYVILFKPAVYSYIFAHGLFHFKEIYKKSRYGTRKRWLKSAILPFTIWIQEFREGFFITAWKRAAL